MEKLWVLGIVALGSILGALGQLFFKLGSDKITGHLMSVLLNWRIFVGLACYAIATVVFIFALRYGRLSILYPIIALSYVWVALISKFYLHEYFPVYKWTGIMFILLGVMIIVSDFASETIIVPIN